MTRKAFDFYPKYLIFDRMSPSQLHSIFQRLLFAMLILIGFEGYSQPNYDQGLFAAASDLFTASEQENLDQLRQDWLALGDRYVLFSNDNFTTLRLEALEENIRK